MTAIPVSAAPEEQRFERIAECYRRDLPSEEEVSRARRRLKLRPVAVRRVSTKLFLAFVVQGFVLGVVTLAAASWVTERVLDAAGPACHTSPGEKNAIEARGRTQQRRSSAEPSRRDESAVAAPRAAFADLGALESSRAAPLATGARAPDRPLDTKLEAAPVQGDRSSAKTSDGTVPAAALPPLPTADGAEPNGPWSRVARALASSDWMAADQALVELGASPDPATRDAAELARTELWIAHGNGARFRGSVERLARSGATALIRRRAAGLLGQLR